MFNETNIIFFCNTVTVFIGEGHSSIHTSPWCKMGVSIPCHSPAT